MLARLTPAPTIHRSLVAVRKHSSEYTAPTARVEQLVLETQRNTSETCLPYYY